MFVLDKSFSSVFYYERAIAFITKTFGELKENDYFGLITLESSMFKDSIVLEQKGNNQSAKLFMFKDQLHHQSFYSGKTQTEQRTKLLDKALSKAVEWQTQVEDSSVEKKGREYLGPHKHIVCLLGGSDFSVSQFALD